MEENETLKAAEETADSIECAAIEEEFPNPSTLQEKERRRLARLEQIRQYKAREMVLDRESRQHSRMIRRMKNLEIKEKDCAKQSGKRVTFQEL